MSETSPRILADPRKDATGPLSVFFHYFAHEGEARFVITRFQEDRWYLTRDYFTLGNIQIAAKLRSSFAKDVQMRLQDPAFPVHLKWDPAEEAYRLSVYAYLFVFWDSYHC